VLLYAQADPLDAASFPTRRSSDLDILHPGNQFVATLLDGSGESHLLPVQGRGLLSVARDTLDSDQAQDALLCPGHGGRSIVTDRSEEHTSELQSRENLVCRLLLEK